ncbi:MAG: SH3 domain-containing protein [Paracoccaceae bacterium]
MFKLTAVLCAAMFGVLLIAGEDRGQLRPGLANASVVAAAAPEVAEVAPVVVVAAADAAPADVAPVSAPVTVAAATTPETEEAIDETVFSLANYSDEVPAEETAATAPQTAGALAYVDAEQVNVREGPGTGNAVLTKLSRGEAVTIVSTDDTGWARIRIEGDGLEGFISMDYLTPAAP